MTPLEKLLLYIEENMFKLYKQDGIELEEKILSCFKTSNQGVSNKEIQTEPTDDNNHDENKLDTSKRRRSTIRLLPLNPLAKAINKLEKGKFKD